MFTSLLPATPLAALLLTGCASSARGPNVALVENGELRRVPASRVAEQDLIIKGDIKTTDSQGK